MIFTDIITTLQAWGTLLGTGGFGEGESFSSKLKNKGSFPIYFNVLNNFSFMHFVDWKPLKIGNRP